MDLFDSKRQERLEAARKAATASKEASLKFLIDAGILEKCLRVREITKKAKKKRLFCCHYQNIYVLLQKQKPGVITSIE